MKVIVNTEFRSCCSKFIKTYVFKGKRKHLKLFFKQNILNRTTPFNLSMVTLWFPPQITCKLTTEVENWLTITKPVSININASGEWKTFKSVAEGLQKQC